jgi:hypothetical protein
MWRIVDSYLELSTDRHIQEALAGVDGLLGLDFLAGPSL